MSNSEKNRNGSWIGSPFNIQTHPNTDSKSKSKNNVNNKGSLSEENNGIRPVGQ